MLHLAIIGLIIFLQTVSGAFVAIVAGRRLGHRLSLDIDELNIYTLACALMATAALVVYALSAPMAQDYSNLLLLGLLCALCSGLLAALASAVTVLMWRAALAVCQDIDKSLLAKDKKQTTSRTLDVKPVCTSTTHPGASS